MCKTKDKSKDQMGKKNKQTPVYTKAELKTKG